MTKFDEWFDAIENPYGRDDKPTLRSAYDAGWEAGQFALNSELGIESNEAAKTERLETFMHHIVTQDMVPLPVERIREWAKELLG